ncbi:MAG: DUF881 domain-containing protein [bacterium]
MTGPSGGGPTRASTGGAGGGPGRRGSLLESLLADPLDPGYADAARRRAREWTGSDGTGSTDPGRPGKSDPARTDRILVAVGAALIGLILVVAYLHATHSAPVDARTRADLRGRVAAAEREGDDLDRQAQSLAAKADALRGAALGGGPDAAALTRAEAAAGRVAVRGPGVRVVLGNPLPSASTSPTGRPGSTPIGAVSALTDVDVRAVVNELWRDGAEAVAVNGVRLLPTSAIRFAGEAVLVDFRPITSPYRIEAIGDSDRLITSFTDSPVAGRYRTLASAGGYEFTSGQVSSLRLPAGVAAPVRYARRPSTSAPSSSAPSSSAPSSGAPSSSAPSTSSPSQAGPS